MKLHNYTLQYFSIALLLIISIWAVIFYFNMLDEVYDSIDDGLENYKILIIQKARENNEVLYKTRFNESNYAITEISKDVAIHMKDTYRDTMLYMQNEEDFEPVRVLTSAFEVNNHFYELKIIASMVEEDDLIEDLFFSLIWLYIILIIVIILVNIILLRRAWRPFYTILHQLKTYRLGKDQIPQKITSSVSEFRELNEVVIALLQRNLETFTNQKQFTENASHELQTPLAIGINKLELLLEKNDLNEAQSESLGQVIQILERLARLNKSLLLLSKIDNKQFFENEEVSINGISKSLIESFSDLSEFKNVTIDYTENGSLNCLMNPGLAGILISNLLKNSIVHNIPGGYVNILVNSSSFTICNTGQERPLDTEKIFSRFYKGTSEKNSTGLGLSIVKAITDLYGFEISYIYINEHCIEVKFSS